MKIEVKKGVIGVAAGLLISASAPLVHAQTTWTGGAGDGLWSSGGNWSTGSVPACSGLFCDVILIDLVGPVLLNTSNATTGAGVGGNLFLGNTTQSTLTVGAGGVLTSSSIVRIGGNSQSSSQTPLGTASGIGILNVENGGQWNAPSVSATGTTLRIGDLGTGILNIRTGGTVTVGNGGIGRLNLGHTATGRGTINIGAAAGDAAVAAGTLIAGNIFFSAGGGRVVFNHTNTDYTFGTSFVSGATDGELDFLSGTTILTANSADFFGTATVGSGATLAFGNGNRTFGNRTVVEGDVTRTSRIIIENGGTLSTVPVGGERAGVTLTIRGDLTLSEQARLYMGLGQAPEEGSTDFGLGDLIIVDGDLVLGGTLQIANIGGFGNGTYEIFRFGGSASGEFANILYPGEFGGAVEIDNANNRILLSVGAEVGDIVYWQGGDGVWNNSDASWTNWTDSGPTLTTSWNSQTASFRTSEEHGVEAGTVQVAEAVDFRGIEFLNNGFRVEGDGGSLNAVVSTDPENPSTIATLNALSNITGVIAADITGEAAIQKTGAGTVVLAGDNSWTGTTSVEQPGGGTWTGSTWIQAGTLQIGDGGTSGNLPGDVLIDGGATVLAFNRSDAYTYGGTISGAGQVRQIGSGTTILTGNNQYGATQVNAGTLQIGNGGTSGRLGTGTVSIASGATLAFNRSDSLTLSNAITGAGSIVQRGGVDSVLTLAGNLSGFTGAARAESGLLNINSTNYGGAVTVGDGGVLGGSGRVGSVTVQSGGRLAPGNSIGTLTVGGNVTFADGSIFEVEANALGESDRLVVQGTANLNGNVVALGEGTGWKPRTEYVILTANVLEGTFDGAVEENFAFLDASLSYGAGAVTLRLDRNDIDFTSVASTSNEAAAGQALQSLTPAHPLFNSVFELMELMTDGEAQYALASMAGEIHASARNMLLDDSRLLRNAVLAQSYDHEFRRLESAVWMRALGHRGEIEGEDSDTLERNAVGLVLGANYRMGDSALNLGWAIGYHTNDSLELDRLDEKGKTNNTHLAVNGSYRLPAGFGLRGGVGMTWHELDIQRRASFTGHDEGVTADYDGESLQTFAEVDYRLKAAGVDFSPFVGMSWVRMKTEGFEEADFRTPIGNTIALRGAGQTDDLALATLGARGQLQLGAVQLEGMLAYQHVISGEDPELRMSFVDGGNAFEIHGAPVPDSSLLADIGIAYAISDVVKLGASYNGLLASDARDHAIQAQLVLTLE